MTPNELAQERPELLLAHAQTAIRKRGCSCSPDDLAQEAALAMTRTAKVDVPNPSAYVATAVARLHLNQHRALIVRHTVPTAPEALPEAADPHTPEENRYVEELRKVLERHSARCKTALATWFSLDPRAATVLLARVLKEPPAGIRQLVAQCLERLQELMPRSLSPGADREPAAEAVAGFLEAHRRTP